MTKNRDKNGRFVAGCKGGPGRPSATDLPVALETSINRLKAAIEDFNAGRLSRRKLSEVAWREHRRYRVFGRQIRRMEAAAQ